MAVQKMFERAVKHQNMLTFKPGIPDGLPPKTFDVLHSVYDNRASQDVRQSENVQLFQTRARLTGQGDQACPVLLPLALL